MFEGIKQRLRAVQYGDAETRRRWFFICVIGLFCVVVGAWIGYLIWRGSFVTGWRESADGVRAAWGTITSQMRDVLNSGK